MSIPFWEYGQSNSGIIFFGEGLTFQENPWETAFISGNQVPGLVEIEAESKKKKDVKTTKGKDGGKTTFQGQGPVDVIMRVKIWTPDQWDQFQTVMARLYVRASGKAAKGAFDIQHPWLSFLGIKSVSVCGFGKHMNAEQGAKWFPVHLAEYKPTSKKSTTKDLDGTVATTKAYNPTTYRQKTDGPAPPSETSSGPTGEKPAPKGGES